MTLNCQLVTIWGGSKGHDCELSASYHQGKAIIDRAGRETAEGSGKNVAESTPQDIDI